MEKIKIKIIGGKNLESSSNRISAIKQLRNLYDLSLKEAKDLTDHAVKASIEVDLTIKTENEAGARKCIRNLARVGIHILNVDTDTLEEIKFNLKQMTLTLVEFEEFKVAKLLMDAQELILP